MKAPKRKKRSVADATNRSETPNINGLGCLSQDGAVKIEFAKKTKEKSSLGVGIRKQQKFEQHGPIFRFSKSKIRSNQLV